MRILLIYTNRNHFLSPPPVGIAYLIAPLKAAQHEVRVLDLMYAKDPVMEMRKALSDFKARAAGYSIRNLDSQDMFSPISPLPEIKQYVDLATQAGVTTILGGTGFSTLPSEILQYMNADFGIAGQGEKSLPLLLHGVQEGSVDKTIPGLVWRDDGVIRNNGVVQTGYAGCVADWSDFSVKNHLGALFAGCVVTKTGCPFKCSYCDVEQLNGSTRLFRDPQEIVDEIKTTQATQGLNTFHLADPAFNTPLVWAKDLLEHMIRARLKIYLSTTMVPAPGSFDDEFFALYRKAGGLSFIMGAESLSDTMLQSYQKPFAVRDMLECSAVARRNGVHFIAELMLGGPGESSVTIQETVNGLEQLKYAHLLYGFGIRIQPGTRLFEQAKSEGFVHRPQDLLFPKFYLSKQLDLAWAMETMRKAAGRLSYRSATMLPTMVRNLVARYLGVVW